MSSENEDQLSLMPPVGSSTPESDPKKPIIRYTRDFFLSLSGLDVCKKLPSGLDNSILSDLDEAANAAFERQRSVGNLSLQGSKRGEYGSQLLNRSENPNAYTRGSSARWDTRSSGSSDREGDLQPDRESFTQDSGKRFVNQNRRTWQHPEHDGLLGSGALAKSSGYAVASTTKDQASGYAVASTTKDQGNDQHQLSRSTEPYQPPRPYKAAPYSRKDGTDSCNDETFGSSECSNQDRAEEERKRRESFELMRKDQQKSLQEKQNKDTHKGNLDVDIMALLNKSDADKNTKSRCKPDESAADSLSRGDSSKSSSHILVPTARPLVPPGFASTLMEKNHQINKLKSTALQSADEKENPSAPSSVVADVSFGNISLCKSGLQEVNEVWEEDITNDSFHKKEAVPDRADAVTQDHSTSIFDKLFGNSVVKNSDSLASDIQNNVNDADEEAWTHLASASSKFAHLFHEESEENRPVEDKSSRDLLSLIVKNDNIGSQVYMSSNDEATKQNKSSLRSENNVSAAALTAAVLSSTASSPIAGMPLESHQSDEQSPSCAVLTCEDLEQSILAEVKGRCSVMQSLQEPWTAVDSKSEEQKDVVDDHASQHLLSLLQRGANPKESLEYPRLDVIGSHEMRTSSDVESSLLQVTENTAFSLSEAEHSSEKHLTLEALFGAAFMNELHSMEAPVSAQKTLVGRVNDSSANEFHGLPFHISDSLSSTSNEQHTNKAVFDGKMFQLNNAPEHTRTPKNAGNWAGYRDSPLHGFKLGDVAFEQASGDIHLPEEDSLISLNDSLDTVASDSLRFQKENRNKSLVPEKMAGDLSDNLLHAILRVGEYSSEPAVDYPPIMQASHEMVDPDVQYHHLQVKPTSQFPHQMNHGRPLFAAHLDHPTFGNSQMNFVSPDSMHHDPHHPFPPNVFAKRSYNTISGPHFDPAARHPVLQPMPLAGNFPSYNPINGLPRLPLSHSINHVPVYSHEMNNLQAFPLHQRQANHGGLGMGMSGSVGGAAGRSSPEALEMLMEMEMRANQKQFHPAMAEHVPGMYGAKLDMNLRYR